MDKVTRQCPQITTIFEEKGEPKRYRTEGLSAYQPSALPLGQTGSLTNFPHNRDRALYTYHTQLNIPVGTQASYTGTHVHDMYPIMNEKGGGMLLLV